MRFTAPERILRDDRRKRLRINSSPSGTTLIHCRLSQDPTKMGTELNSLFGCQTPQRTSCCLERIPGRADLPRWRLLRMAPDSSPLHSLKRCVSCQYHSRAVTEHNHVQCTHSYSRGCTTTPGISLPDFTTRHSQHNTHGGSPKRRCGRLPAMAHVIPSPKRRRKSRGSVQRTLHSCVSLDANHAVGLSTGFSRLQFCLLRDVRKSCPPSNTV